jgi:hypothetical protein
MARFLRSALPAPSERGTVREEGEVLEDGRRRPLVRRQVDERLAVEDDVPFRRVLVPADHPQRGRLSAAGRAEQDDVLPVIDVQVDVFHGERAAGELLREPDQVETRSLRRRGGGRRRPLCVRLCDPLSHPALG